MVELVKTPELNTVDLNAPIPDKARILESLCHLFSLCVTMYVDTVKKVRKSVVLNTARLDYISTQVGSVPQVCS